MKLFLQIFYGFLTLIVALELAFAGEGTSPNLLLVNSIIGFFSYVAAALYLVKTCSYFSWVGMFNLFCTSYMIVNFQVSFLAWFVPDIANEKFIWLTHEVGNKASCLSLMGFLFFLIAYLARCNSRHRMNRRRVDKTISSGNLQRAVYVVCGASAIMFTLFLATVGPAYLSGGYDGSKNWGAGSSYFFLLFQVLLFSAIAIDLYRLRLQFDRLNLLGYLKNLNWVALFLAGMFVLLSLYTGDRGPILRVLLLYGASYGVMFWKIRFPVFVIIILTGAVCMTFLSFYRTRDETASIEERVESGKYRLEEIEWYMFTRDLAFSFRTVNAVVYFNWEEPLFGRTMVMDVVAPIPLAAGVLARTYVHTGLGFTSGNYITNLISPVSRLGHQTGAGTTLIADSFLNFHIPGVLVCMAMIGYFIAWIEVKALLTRSIYTNTIYVLLLSFAVYWPRSAVFFPAREVIWCLLIVFVIRLLFGKVNVRVNGF